MEHRHARKGRSPSGSQTVAVLKRNGHSNGHHAVWGHDALCLVSADQLGPAQVLQRLAVHRETMLDQVQCVADGVTSWRYPPGILKVICQYTLRWYTPRDKVGDIRMCRDELYLFAFTGFNAAESAQFVLCDEGSGDERSGDEEDRQSMEHRVAVFNWGLRYNDSVCVNERASGREWKEGDAVHLKVDTRCRGGARLQFWITADGVCSRGICIEIEGGRRALRLALNGGFALKTGVKLC